MKFLRNFLFITLPSILVVFVLLELFFRFVIPAAEIPEAFFDEEEMIYRFDTRGRQTGMYTIGKAAQQRGRWRINNFGWNSDIDYSEDPGNCLIAVFGDSFVEAFQVDVDESFPALMRKAIDTCQVYAVAKSGAPLSEYLHYSRYANRHFDPDILIFTVVHNDFHESILNLNPGDRHILTVTVRNSAVTENDPRPNYSFSQYNWKKRWVKKSALFRYLHLNLHITATIRNFGKGGDGQDEFNANVKVPVVSRNKEMIRIAVDYILGRIASENPGKRVIFVMDGPRNDIYTQNLDSSNVVFLNEMIGGYCSKYGFEYIDLTVPMKEDFERNNTYFNTELDGHWNEYGHRFVAGRILERLSRENNSGSPSRQK